MWWPGNHTCSLKCSGGKAGLKRTKEWMKRIWKVKEYFRSLHKGEGDSIVAQAGEQEWNSFKYARKK